MAEPSRAHPHPGPLCDKLSPECGKEASGSAHGAERAIPQGSLPDSWQPDFTGEGGRVTLPRTPREPACPPPHSAAQFPLETQKAKPTHSWWFQIPGQVHCDIMRRKAQTQSDGTGRYHGAIQRGLRLSWSLSAGRCQSMSQKKKIL